MCLRPDAAGNHNLDNITASRTSNPLRSIFATIAVEHNGRCACPATFLGAPERSGWGWSGGGRTGGARTKRMGRDSPYLPARVIFAGQPKFKKGVDLEPG